MWRHAQYILTGLVGGILDRAGRAVCQRAALYLSPQMIHGVEFRSRSGQEAHLNPQRLGQLQALFGRMGRAPIFKQHNSPSAPMRPQHGQKILMGFLDPLVGDQQQHCAAADIEDPMQDPFSPVPVTGTRTWVPIRP